ncbi:uncharacterized protein DUF4421 [Chitinophaga dinghuensis]|uniref:Uncharacterized protein DUF4421 n=2 Tax=Chitinophaga dinghuensis TaxID=1539050 RepID=A0A327W3N4_9BACT|nr:uncharacterized protein DUF4421 [Chitinophaga dinghuensis]
MTHMTKRLFLLACLICAALIPAAGQNAFWRFLKTETDSAYVEDYTNELTARLYSSRKYNRYDIVDVKLKKDILYRPNSPMNIGFGANYKFLGLNLGFNFPFVNRHNEKYGQTKYLDLQTHIYLRKIVVDFYGQTYKGFYIANPDKVFGKEYVTQNPYPQRPDIRNTAVGLNAQYIFNDKKFSYRAPNLQNEYQKRSAGSFLVGGDIFHVQVKGDSSLVPYYLEDTAFLHDFHYHKSSIISTTANAGYAYTFVYKHHWFLSLSVTGGLGVNRTKLFLEDGSISRSFGWQINSTVRAALGYNSANFFAGIHYVGTSNRSEMPLPNAFQTFGAGNLRLSIVRRFPVNRKLSFPSRKVST